MLYSQVENNNQPNNQDCNSTLNIKYLLYSKHFHLVDFNNSEEFVRPTFFNDNVLFSYGNKIVELNVKDFNKRDYRFANNIKTNGNLNCNEDFIVMSLFDGNVYIYNKKNKTWYNFKHNHAILSKPIFDGNDIFFIDIFGCLIKLNLMSHKYAEFVIKNRSTNVASEIAEPIIYKDLILYTGTLGQLFFINKNTMEMVHKIVLDGNSYHNSQLNHLIIDNKIFLTTSSNTYCIDIDEKSVIWKLDMDSNSPLTRYEDFIVFTNNNVMYYVSIESGKIQKQFKFPSFISSIALHNSKLLVFDITNNLYIFAKDNSFFAYNFGVDVSFNPVIIQSKKDLYVFFLNNKGEINIFSMDIS